MDEFPLTWGPMFVASPTNKTEYIIASAEPNEVIAGIEVDYFDGSKGRLNHKDLNIPFRVGSIEDGYVVLYRSLIALCDKKSNDFGLIPFIVQKNRKHRKREIMHRILRSINKTLDRKQQDPNYVVNLSVRRRLNFFFNLQSEPGYRELEPLGLLSCKHLTGRPSR